MTELSVIVDEQDNFVSFVPRAEMRAKNLLHRGVMILVFNDAGELFVHKQSKHKDLSPSYYDLCILGNMANQEEPYEQTAKRELKEELGIEAPLKHLFKFRFRAEFNNVWNEVYKIINNGPFSFDDEEIVSGSFMSIKDVKEMIKKESFVPKSLAMFKKFLEKYYEAA